MVQRLLLFVYYSAERRQCALGGPMILFKLHTRLRKIEFPSGHKRSHTPAGYQIMRWQSLVNSSHQKLQNGINHGFIALFVRKLNIFVQYNSFLKVCLGIFYSRWDEILSNKLAFGQTRFAAAADPIEHISEEKFLSQIFAKMEGGPY